MKLGEPKIVGEMLRNRRHELGMTIEQFAQATGVSPITIMRIELGRVGYVHEKTARALEVPKKIVNRLVTVPTAVDSLGNVIERPAPLTPSEAALIKTPEWFQPIRPEGQTRESTTGDSTNVGAPMTKYYKRARRARSAKLEAKKANVERDSKLKRALLWLADRVS